MGIVYVLRDGLGRIAGVSANPQPDYAEEEAYDDFAEVQAFLNPPPPPLTTRDNRAIAHVDVKQLLGDPVALDLIARTILDVARVRGVTQVGGLELGAAPLIGAVVCRSARRYPLAGFVVRKAAKEHGTQKRIEGWFEPMAPTLLVEDVTTTGASALAALAAVREEGGNAEMVIAVVDREAGAAEALAAEGCELLALARLSELLPRPSPP